MLLLTSTGPALRRALEEGLTRQGHAVRSPFTSSSLELLVAALGCRTILYTAGNSMRAAQLTPRPSPPRVRQVLLAAAVPGVDLVLGVVPAGEAYLEEEQLLKSADVPSVVLRCAPLVEELQTGAPWSKSGAPLRVTTGELLTSTVVRVLEDASFRGQTLEVPTILLNPAWSAARVVRRSSVADWCGAPALTCVGGSAAVR